LDTLRRSKEFQIAGFTKIQSEKRVEAWNDNMNENFITKSEFKVAMSQIDARFTELELKITVRLTLAMVFIVSTGLAIQTYFISQIVS